MKEKRSPLVPMISVMVIAAIVGAYFLIRFDGKVEGGDDAGLTPSPSEYEPRPDLPPPADYQAEMQRPGSSGPTSNSDQPLSPEDSEQIAAWNAEISEALADDSISNQDAVTKLLALANDPNVNEGVRLDALEHSLNLSEDEEFSEIMPLWTDSSTPVEMLDSILTDLYNRGDRVKLQSVLEAAKIDNHPLKEDTVELLEFYVDDNFGDDWPAWEAALQQYFAENEIE